MTLPYSTSDGTATSPADYYVDGSEFYFAPGDTSDSFTISTVNDSEVEGTENFHLNFGQPTGATFSGSASTMFGIDTRRATPFTRPSSDAPR